MVNVTESLAFPLTLLGVYLSANLPQGAPFPIGTIAQTFDAGVKYWNGSSWTSSPINLTAVIQFNAVSFGADPTGVTDSTFAIQSAINAATAVGGGLVYFSPGNYLISSTLTIPSSVSLVGSGAFFTKISWSSLTLTTISVASDQAFYMKGLQLSGPLNSTSGRMIQITGSATQNFLSTIEECIFSGGYSQIYCVSASSITLQNNYHSGFQQSGAHIENQFNPDAGDSTIFNCTFSNSPNTTTSVCIEQFSSGGLKALCNKMNTGAYGYRMVMASGINTSDLLLNFNSIENQTIAAINISSSGGGAVWTNLDISNNQVALVPAAITSTLGYAATSGWVLGANRISLNSSASGVGISLQWVSGANISGNALTPGAVTQNAIVTDANTSGNLGVNTYALTWAQKLTIGIGSMFVTPSVLETGIGAVTCSTVYGSIFSGTVAVTFAQAFDLVPTVDCDFGSVNGGVSAVASSITKTGCTITCLSVINGGSGNVTYRARGVV